ncbi:hypothetical protein X942_5794 [Burkholderia pseudomallei MSHR5596]|nr:hypothetical protein X942_5794 [Burkholderia pseudomallei MSHR5596]
MGPVWQVASCWACGPCLAPIRQQHVDVRHELFAGARIGSIPTAPLDRPDLHGGIEQLMGEGCDLVGAADDPEVVFAVELADDVYLDQLVILPREHARPGMDRRVAAAFGVAGGGFQAPSPQNPYGSAPQRRST